VAVAAMLGPTPAMVSRFVVIRLLGSMAPAGLTARSTNLGHRQWLDLRALPELLRVKPEHQSYGRGTM
jgi:hypothetical protein